jgi:predicted negative regulator of RcsB-dependent stress response
MASPSVAQRTRQTVDSDDAVMMRAAELAEWARNNARIILIAAAVALVAVGGFLYYQLDKSSRAARASSEYLALQAQLAGADSAGQLRQLESFARKYAGSVEAAEARMQLGEGYLRQGNAKKAIAELRPVAEGSTPVAFQARSMLAAALATDGQRDAAIREYVAAAEESELAYQKQEVLQQAALLREEAGNHAGALELYRQILATTEEGSLERSIIELRIAEAEARAGGAAAPAADNK